MRVEELTVQEIVEIIDNWNIRHQNQVKNKKKKLDGLVDPNKVTIYLTSNLILPDRRLTVIHELIHASDFNRGYNVNERETERRAKANYEKIYGLKAI